MKATPAELALAIIALVAVCAPGTWADRRSWLTAVAAVVFGLMCLTSSLNLGVRYVSVLYPLGAVLACGWLARNISPRPTLWAGLTAVAIAVQGWAASVAFRDELAYFNPLAGGPAGGHRYLADSNLDWGQGLPALSAEVKARRPAKWVLAYYEYQSGGSCTVEPAAYGLTGFVPWRQATAADLEGADLLAVSTSLLVGMGNNRAGEFAPLRGVTPIARIGTGFWLYDLTDPTVRAAAVAARFGRAD